MSNGVQPTLSLASMSALPASNNSATRLLLLNAARCKAVSPLVVVVETKSGLCLSRVLILPESPFRAASQNLYPTVRARSPEHPETTHTPQSKMTDKLFPIVSKPQSTAEASRR